MRSQPEIEAKRTASTAPWRPLAAALVAAAVCLPLTAEAAEEPTTPGATLSEAIDRALEHSPEVVSATGQVQVASASVRSAIGAYLPSVTASAGSSLAGPGAEDGARTSFDAGVSLSWDVFTGLRRGAQLDQARSDSAIANASLTQSRSSVALAVEQVFYSGLRARELEQVARSRLEVAQESLGAAQRRSTAGNGTQSDVLRAQLELNRARQSLLEARTQLQEAALQLGRLMGADGAVEPLVDEQTAASAPALDADGFLAELALSAPQVRAAEAAVRASAAVSSVARSEYFPQLTLGAGYDLGGAGAGDGVLPLESGWSVRVGMSLPLFDGFRRGESSTRARVLELSAQAALADARREVRAAAEQLLGRIELAEQQISLAEQAVAVAREDLRVQQERYQMGLATMLDLVTSQTGMVEAQTDLVGARFDQRLASAELTALAGRLP